MKRVTTNNMDGCRADRCGGERDGIGTHGLTHSRSCQGTGYFSARLDGDFIRPGGCTEPRFMGMATCTAVGSIITTSARIRRRGDPEDTTLQDKRTRREFTADRARCTGRFTPEAGIWADQECLGRREVGASTQAEGSSMEEDSTA